MGFCGGPDGGGFGALPGCFGGFMGSFSRSVGFRAGPNGRGFGALPGLFGGIVGGGGESGFVNSGAPFGGRLGPGIVSFGGGGFDQTRFRDGQLGGGLCAANGGDSNGGFGELRFRALRGIGRVGAIKIGGDGVGFLEGISDELVAGEDVWRGISDPEAN